MVYLATVQKKAFFLVRDPAFAIAPSKPIASGRTSHGTAYVQQPTAITATADTGSAT
jgi:hypothetical protein